MGIDQVVRLMDVLYRDRMTLDLTSGDDLMAVLLLVLPIELFVRSPTMQWRRTDRLGIKEDNSVHGKVVEDIGYNFKIGRAGRHPLGVFSPAESCSHCKQTRRNDSIC